MVALKLLQALAQKDATAGSRNAVVALKSLLPSKRQPNKKGKKQERRGGIEMRTRPGPGRRPGSKKQERRGGIEI